MFTTNYFRYSNVTWPCMHFNRDRNKMVAIFQTTFSNAFFWREMFEFRFICYWSLFLRGQLTTFQHWFRQWLGAGKATSHYLNQWWLSLLTEICFTRPRWVKSWEVQLVQQFCLSNNKETSMFHNSGPLWEEIYDSPHNKSVILKTLPCFDVAMCI